ncbi:hypothetical protein [Christiangramia aquimixticola]|uniref:hypothetical protein n=1 Tax=Christiangramia aquimixticola TaxID=1697558 RepID=UPI003AA859C9
MIPFLLADSFPNDSGPIYQETLAGRLPVEPFNTFSNIFFLIIIVYFSLRVYRDYNNQKFLAWSLPVLFLGFIGGTVYHATRSHDFWMYLDWLPIIFLCLAVSIYYTFKVEVSKTKRYWLIGIILFLVFGIRMIPWGPGLKTSIGYIGTALGLLLPVITYFFTNSTKNWSLVFLAFLCFGFAISFRLMDNFLYLLPMGTHWLWHSFGAFSVYFLMDFIYRDRAEVASVPSAEHNS